MKTLLLLTVSLLIVGCSEHVPGRLVTSSYQACHESGSNIADMWVYDGYGTSVKVRCRNGRVYEF